MSNIVDWTSTAWSILHGLKIINVLCCGCRILLFMVSQPWRRRSVCLKSLLALLQRRGGTDSIGGNEGKWADESKPPPDDLSCTNYVRYRRQWRELENSGKRKVFTCMELHLYKVCTIHQIYVYHMNGCKKKKDFSIIYSFILSFNLIYLLEYK